MNVSCRRLPLLICLSMWGVCANCAPIPLRCAIVGAGDNSGAISMEAISNKITEVNRIFRQVAMSFEVASCICTNDTALSEVAMTNSSQRARLYSTIPNGDGLKMFFVKSTIDDVAAFWNHYGIIVEASASAVTIAHELGHACGLEDVYSQYDGSNFVIAVSGPIGKARMPDDWGRYSSDTDQGDFVRRLLMYGIEDERGGVDMPYGDVDGVWCDAANMDVAYANSNCWHTSLAPVGFHYHGNRHPRSEDWVED